MPERVEFMSANLPLAGRQEVLAAIESATPDQPVRLATVNPEFLLEAQDNPAFRESLERMTHCTVDGSGFYFALLLQKLLQKTAFTPELYHGSDLIEELFRRHQHGEKRFFFLGGMPGVAEEAAKNIRRRYPQIKITGTSDGGSIDREKVVVRTELQEEITASGPDILLVGFGAPKQELWIDKARDLPVPTMIGVGGTLDFYGQKKRAPRAVRQLHMEWFYRLLTEHNHWKRAYRATAVFSVQALKWIFSSKSAE